jgi:hypothetical protein
MTSEPAGRAGAAATTTTNTLVQAPDPPLSDALETDPRSAKRRALAAPAAARAPPPKIDISAALGALYARLEVDKNRALGRDVAFSSYTRRTLPAALQRSAVVAAAAAATTVS